MLSTTLTLTLGWTTQLFEKATKERDRSYRRTYNYLFIVKETQRFLGCYSCQVGKAEGRETDGEGDRKGGDGTQETVCPGSFQECMNFDRQNVAAVSV